MGRTGVYKGVQNLWLRVYLFRFSTLFLNLRITKIIHFHRVHGILWKNYSGKQKKKVNIMQSDRCNSNKIFPLNLPESLRPPCYYQCKWGVSGFCIRFRVISAKMRQLISESNDNVDQSTREVEVIPFLECKNYIYGSDSRVIWFSSLNHLNLKTSGWLMTAAF